jgi:hypothetical protein
MYAGLYAGTRSGTERRVNLYNRAGRARPFFAEWSAGYQGTISDALWTWYCSPPQPRFERGNASSQRGSRFLGHHLITINPGKSKTWLRRDAFHQPMQSGATTRIIMRTGKISFIWSAIWSNIGSRPTPSGDARRVLCFPTRALATAWGKSTVFRL